MKITDKNKARLTAFFEEGYNHIDSEPEYWIHNADESVSYCLECCEKEVRRLLKKDPMEEYEVDGGWRVEGDSTAFCKKCQTLLDNSLTDYGCESEVEHFIRHGFDCKSWDDRRAMAKVVSARGWEFLKFGNKATQETEKQYFKDFYILCNLILKQLNALN